MFLLPIVFLTLPVFFQFLLAPWVRKEKENKQKTTPMYRSLLNSIGVLCLAVLWRPVAAIGSGNTAYMRRVLLAAQAGLDPNLVLDDKMDFHSLISHPPHQEPPPEAEFVTVC